MKDFLGIETVKALEVLDSRGNPTVQVEVVTEGGFGADLGAEKFLDIKCRRRIFRSCNGSIWSINRKL